MIGREMATKAEQFRLQVTPWFFHYCNGRLSDAQRLRHFHLSFLDFFTQFGEVDIEQDVCRHRLSFGRDFGFFIRNKQFQRSAPRVTPSL